MMKWFPGLFTIGELQQMDVRVSAYWVRQAQIKALEEQMRMMQAARAAQATEGGYKQTEYKIRQEISILKLFVTRRQIQDRNWMEYEEDQLAKKKK